MKTIGDLYQEYENTFFNINKKNYLDRHIFIKPSFTQTTLSKYFSLPLYESF